MADNDLGNVSVGVELHPEKNSEKEITKHVKSAYEKGIQQVRILYKGLKQDINPFVKSFEHLGKILSKPIGAGFHGIEKIANIPSKVGQAIPFFEDIKEEAYKVVDVLNEVIDKYDEIERLKGSFGFSNKQALQFGGIAAQLEMQPEEFNMIASAFTQAKGQYNFSKVKGFNAKGNILEQIMSIVRFMSTIKDPNERSAWMQKIFGSRGFQKLGGALGTHKDKKGKTHFNIDDIMADANKEILQDIGSDKDIDNTFEKIDKLNKTQDIAGYKKALKAYLMASKTGNTRYKNTLNKQADLQNMPLENVNNKLNVLNKFLDTQKTVEKMMSGLASDASKIVNTLQKLYNLFEKHMDNQRKNGATTQSYTTKGGIGDLGMEAK